MKRLGIKYLGSFWLLGQLLASSDPAVAGTASLFVGKLTVRDFHEISLDLDRDGKFDYYEQIWGPIRIVKVYSQNVKSKVFNPILNVWMTLTKGLVYQAKFSCDIQKCQLQKSYRGSPEVFYKTDVIDLKEPLATPAGALAACQISPNVKHLNELFKTVEKSKIDLAVGTRIDESCQEGGSHQCSQPNAPLA